jgi:hypothetical protein
LTGTWATFVEVGVGWESGTIRAGAGTTRQWVIGKRSVQDGRVIETARACGIGAQGVPLGSPWFSTIDVPAIMLESEWTGVEFAPELFDSGRLPEVLLEVSLGSSDPANAQLGDTFSTPDLPFSFGVEGLAPDAWPPTDEMRPLTVDHDGDGNPGLTGFPFQGPVPGEPDGTVFRNPRLGLEVETPRAAALYMTIRTRAALSGSLVSCDPPRFEGEVAGNSLLIETRNVDCKVADTNAPCDPAQVGFIDTNLPAFESNGVSRVVSVKIPDDSSCADVRAMDFSPSE